MTTRGRGGFTLVELLVVAVLGTLVLGAVLQTLVINQRTYTAQRATVEGQQSTRMALEVLFAELREVSASGGDLLGFSADTLRVRMMRKFGAVCDTTTAVQPILTVYRQTNIFGLFGSNVFAAGDSVFIFADNDEDDDDDDVWFPAAVTAAVSTAIVCPDLTPAMALTFSGQGAAFIADTVGIGAPVRSFLTYTFGDTAVLGEPYLARRTGSGAMVPIAGPIRRTDGLEFIYRDALGATTTVGTDVRQIEVKVRTGSNVLNSVGETVSDSITAWIYTRN